MAWRYSEGQLLYENDLVKVTLKEAKEAEKGIRPNDIEGYGLSPYFLFEWKTYRVLIGTKNGYRVNPDSVEIFFGGNKAEYDQEGFWEYKFKNYIGKSDIKIRLKDRSLPSLQLEVISPKLSLNKGDRLFYPNFYRALVRDLEFHQMTLLFEIISPTYIYTEDVPVPPNLLILFHQILESSQKILEGLGTVLADPHRDLTIIEEYVDLHQVDTIDPEICLSIIRNSHLLMKSSLVNIPLSSKLGGHMPRKILQYKKVETFDNLENRFVKRFIIDLLNHIEQITKTYGTRIDEKMETIVELRKNLEKALLSECLERVGELGPATFFGSQVLLKKEGYRELLEAYNKLLLSKQPIFTYLQEKIDQRNIAEMYEFWCFFELSRKLADLFGIKPESFKLKVETAFEGGLAQNQVKTILGDYELIYNKKYNRSSKGSYSITLKPDFSLMECGEAMIVFDSKFRFDILQESEEKSAEDVEEEAIISAEIDRIANISDLYKMHTYKDALNAKSAVILYPGNRNVFYSKCTREKTEGTFEEVLEKICRFEEGIGYLSLIPSKATDKW